MSMSSRQGGLNKHKLTEGGQQSPRHGDRRVPLYDIFLICRDFLRDGYQRKGRAKREVSTQTGRGQGDSLQPVRTWPGNDST